MPKPEFWRSAPLKVLVRVVPGTVTLPENVPLETEEAVLGQQYQKLSGSLTVNFRGKEQTLVQMARHLEEPAKTLFVNTCVKAFIG